MEDLLKITEEEFYDNIADISSNYPLKEENKGFPSDLYEAFKSGKAKDIDMLIGTNQNETMYYSTKYSELYFRIGYQVMYENDLKKMSKEDQDTAQQFMDLLSGKRIKKVEHFYDEIVFRLPLIKVADYHSDNQGNTYFYHFKYDAELPLGAYHTLELPYIFNNFKNTFFEEAKENENVIKNIQDMWVNFARNGNPSTDEVEWEKFDSENRKTMIIDEKCEMADDYNGEEGEMLDDLLKYNIKGDNSNLSYNTPIVYQVVGQVLIALIFVTGVIALLRKIF